MRMRLAWSGNSGSWIGSAGGGCLRRLGMSPRELYHQPTSRTIRAEEFADQEAVAAIVTITAGNFRLIDRLMSQVRRIKELNRLTTVTRELVDAARDCLVIGTA